MNGGVVFLIILLVLIALSYAGWVVYTRLNASKLGLPPPSLNPITAFRNRGSGNIGTGIAPRAGGLIGWVNDKIRGFKNKRTAAGAYESSSAPRGRAMDPDEAWDSRVGNEAYYEEQELGLHSQPTAYGGGGYGAQAPLGYEREEFGERGRSRTREYDARYEAETGAGGRRDPFGDHAEARAGDNPFGDEQRSDLRGVSPRPVEDGHGGVKKGDSPTERRSMFRENM